jgi:ParB family transcriptional regulator, chromosome partitioning protein
MRQALGKGLEALIPKQSTPHHHGGNSALKVPIEKIRPNHLQPRKSFDPEHLAELAASIKEHGLAQPILVSFDPSTDGYELIAGERRLRASELAGLKEIDVVVRNPATEKERLALALIENLQREDLNAIDAALGYLRLMKESQLTQSQLTQIIGKSKSTISNTLRLLELPEDMQKAVQFGRISEGHARALLSVADPIERQALFVRVEEEKLSVRETEEAARALSADAPPEEKRRAGRPAREIPADIRALESTLQQSLGTKIEIRTKKDGHAGTLRIHFYSLTDFEKIINLLKK